MLIGWWFVKELNIELPNHPAMPLLGIYPKELKAEVQTDIFAPTCEAVLFIRPNSGNNTGVF